MKWIKTEIKDRLAYISINRPEKRNALNDKVVLELIQAFKAAEENSEVKIIVLTGQGNTFCAGADLEYLKQLQNNSYEDNLKDSRQLMELYKIIYQLSKIVIAQVNGHAIAGGCGLVTVCDFAFSIPDANFGYTETRIGFIPAIVMSFLVRKIGEARAKELLLTGNVIHSQQALTYGLIHQIVDDENALEKTVYDFAQEICTHNSAQSIAMTKKLMADIQNMTLSESLKYAAEMNAQARSSEDCKRGIDAFLNKTTIKW
ncbi:MAG TPA: enoyl-CoA hydratase-related protein [Cytophagaceae bacterium]|jgi:methylglutaconyl-CoA hydratase|nr:enoyl-CoA hydratase-related protein [Cytophagaceae bacterium]